MKLLKQSQITNNLANERAEQIKEGLKLAKKVDVLRETLASFESQHAKFIAGSQEELIKATEGLQVKKREIEGEIIKLEQKRAKLLKPLDDEWATLNEAKTKHKEDLETLNIKNNELQIKEKDITEAEKQLEKERVVTNERKAEAEEFNQQARQARDRAKELKSRREQEYADFKADSAKRAAEQDGREKALVVQANYNEHQKNILDKRENDLNNKDRKINDKYETLMRTITRLKK